MSHHRQNLVCTIIQGSVSLILTESDSVFLISNLSVSYYSESVTPQAVYTMSTLCCSYITVEDVDVCEPVRKKPRLDMDRDSAMGLSASGKSTTLSEASLLSFQLQITHLLKQS